MPLPPFIWVSGRAGHRELRRKFLPRGGRRDAERRAGRPAATPQKRHLHHTMAMRQQNCRGVWSGGLKRATHAGKGRWALSSLPEPGGSR